MTPTKIEHWTCRACGGVGAHFDIDSDDWAEFIGCPPCRGFGHVAFSVWARQTLILKASRLRLRLGLG
jgi:hypothetical protein